MSMYTIDELKQARTEFTERLETCFTLLNDVPEYKKALEIAVAVISEEIRRRETM